MRRQRDEAIGRLQEAFADDAIDLEELDRRLDGVERAETEAALAAVTADLPTPRGQALAPAGSARVLAVLGGAERRGELDVPARMDVFAFWGGAEIDLRRARFSGRHELSCVAIMGGISVLVPAHVRVSCHGLGLLGGFRDRSRGSADPAAPELVISGFSCCGGVDVRTKGSPAPRRLRRG